MAVGEIIGRADSFEFKMRVLDPYLKRGDYVISEHDPEGLVLCAVKNVFKEKNKGSKELETIAEVRVVGYRDSAGVKRIPKNAFKPGAVLWKADSKFIKRVLALSKPENGLYLGLLDGYPDLPIELDLHKITTKHLAVLAQSGSGKSYTVAVLLEELLERKVPLVVIDPHGEYASLREPNDEPRDSRAMQKFGVSPKTYSNAVEYSVAFGENKLFLNGFNLKSQEIAALLPSKLNSSQVGVLYEAIKSLKKRLSSYSLDDVVREVEAQEGSAKWAIASALQELVDADVFGAPTPLNELVKEGQASVINLKGASLETQQSVVARLLTDLFQARKFSRIPPFFLVIEEAHNFAPERSFGEVASSRVVRTLASEGRKFGLGLCIVSQRPARVDKNVLSQCNTQVVLKMTNPNDIRAVSASMESFDETMDSEIRGLAVGTAIVSGEGADGSLCVEVRPRRSRHGGKAQASQELHEPLLKQKPRFIKAKQSLSKQAVEAAGLTVHSMLEHRFWLAETRQGSLLLDAKYGKIYCPSKFAERLVALKEFKHASDLSSLDSVEAIVFNEVLKRRELFDHELPSCNSLVKFERATVASALEALVNAGWVRKTRLGQINSYSFEQTKLRFAEEKNAVATEPAAGEPAMAFDERAAKELFEPFAAVESISLLEMPVFVAATPDMEAVIISGA
ncbi:TPA: ATP-binding protein [Candidatus Micrarchaeota archaeon]|nr:ATP-binding protein [Candidatus Micrarchaeota archaeon]